MEKTEGHVTQSPQALSRILSVELKGHLDCRRFPEWDLDLMWPTESFGRSRAPKTESIEYWNVKGQAAAAELPFWRISARLELSRPIGYK
jgi:hypothetical protein